MSHQAKIDWMKAWAETHGASLSLNGSCGSGIECVGILVDGKYPDYDISNVWTPHNAYKEHACVAVLEYGKEAEEELFEWLKWFDENGYSITQEKVIPDPSIPAFIAKALKKDISVKMTKK